MAVLTVGLATLAPQRPAGLPSPSEHGGFGLFFEFFPSCARSAAISTRRASTVAVSASVVLYKAVFVAAIAFTSAIRPSRDKSSGSLSEPAQQTLSLLPHRYPRPEYQTNPSIWGRKT